MKSFSGMKWIFLVFLLVFLLPQGRANAWDGSDKPVGVLKDYILDLKIRDVPMFVSQCFVSNHVKAVLVFKLRNEVGDLFFIHDDEEGGKGMVATASARIKMADHGFKAYNVTGISISDLKEFSRFLLAAPFELYPPDQIDKIYTVAAQHSC